MILATVVIVLYSSNLTTVRMYVDVYTRQRKAQKTCIYGTQEDIENVSYAISCVCITELYGLLSQN